MRYGGQVLTLFLLFFLLLITVDFSTLDVCSTSNQTELSFIMSRFSPVPGVGLVVNSKGDVIVGGTTTISCYLLDGSLKWRQQLMSETDKGIYDIALTSNDEVVIVGSTSDPGFPILNGLYENLSGGLDAFVAKFSSNGSLMWSTFLGGNSSDSAQGVAINIYDEIAVTGMTGSHNFPLVDATYSEINGCSDAFISYFSSSGILEWSTFFGGEKGDLGRKVVFDSDNNIILLGQTESSELPMKNSFDPTYNGVITNGYGDDLFLAKFQSEGTLIWSTYFGGMYEDYGIGIDLDKNDNIYIAGRTFSQDFPFLNEYHTKFNGTTNSFIVKFSFNGSLLWSTFLGGESNDGANGIVLDDHGNIFITGHTYPAEFPMVNPLDDSHNGVIDVFIVIFSKNHDLIYGTLLGGAKRDLGFDIDIYQDNVLCVSGSSESDDFPGVPLEIPSRNSDKGFVTWFSIVGTPIDTSLTVPSEQETSTSSIYTITLESSSEESTSQMETDLTTIPSLTFGFTMSCFLITFCFVFFFRRVKGN